MSDVVVLINDEELVLEKSGDIVGTYAINKLGDIASRQPSYTNTFNAPVSSSKNKEIAESAQQINSQSTVPYVKQTAEIRVGGSQAMLGFAQLKSAKDFFQWVIKSGNADLFERIKGLSLRDLDLSAYDHIWSAANVYASRDNTYVDGYIYPDIDYGLFPSEVSTTQVYTTFFPATFQYVIFQAIITEAGFTVSGNFLTNTLFRKKILPFTGVDLLHNSDWVNLKSFRAKMIPQSLSATMSELWIFGFDNDSTDGFFDNDNQFVLGAWNLVTPLSYFLNNEVADFYFEATVTYTVTSWTNGVSYLQILLPSVLGGNNNYTHTDAQGVGTFTATVSGNRVQEVVGYDLWVETTIIQCDVTYDSGVFFNTPQYTLYPESTININSSLPDIKQSDFILNLANQFALFFQANNLTNNVKIFQFNDVIDNIPNAKDWRQKVDLSETPEKKYLFEDYAQDNSFAYKTDEADIYLSLEPEYGAGEIVVANEFLQPFKKLFESVFAPIKRISSFADTVTIAYIPKYNITTGDNEIDAVPRDAYVDVTNTSNLLQVTGQPTRTTSPAVYFTDLEFENLIAEYYDPLERLLNKAKVVTALVRLTVADINQLDFEYPVLFTVDGEDGYFYINEVKQFKFNTKESTEVELVLLRP